MTGHKINKFDQRKIESILKTENQFISNLFSILAIPQDTQHDEDSEVEVASDRRPLVNIKTSRATSLVELQNRIEKLKGKSNTYKEKQRKKSLKNKLKKKLKQEKRNALKKSSKKPKSPDAAPDVNLENGLHSSDSKPVFNKDDKMVFSKIDFAGLGKEKHRKTEKDPKKILEQVEQTKSKIQKLKEKGEKEKAVEIKEKMVWKNALAKAQGIKVKDDPTLLKKSIQKMEQKKRSSKKKWTTRIQGVKNAKDEKQKKRMANIEKRKKDKKLHKLKKAAKKGKIIPGL